MFGKLSASNDADKGGLAIDPTEFMSNAPHQAWWRGEYRRRPVLVGFDDRVVARPTRVQAPACLPR